MATPINNHEIRKLLLAYPQKAIKILYDQYAQGLALIAYHLTHDKDAAKDIVQETFTHVWLNHVKLGNNHEKSIQHYLVRVVRNKAISFYKESVSVGQKKIRMLNNYPHATTEPSVETHIIQVEVTQQIWETIARLPKRERECLTLKMQLELHNDEIARRLGVGTKAVEKSLTSAKKRLRRLLKK